MYELFFDNTGFYFARGKFAYNAVSFEDEAASIQIGITRKRNRHAMFCENLAAIECVLAQTPLIVASLPAKPAKTMLAPTTKRMGV